MTNIDELNEKFMAEWPKRVENDEVLKFLKKVFSEGDQSMHSLRDAISNLMTVRESEIKEQVLKEMKISENDNTVDMIVIEEAREMKETK